MPEPDDNKPVPWEENPHWTEDELRSFLALRQEFFLDPTGSNRQRLEEACGLLLRALFGWYLSQPGEFAGIVALLRERMPAWQALKRQENDTLGSRRLLLNSPWSDVPAVEGSVSTGQWQRIVGSLADVQGQKTFERFLKDLDEFTDPSLRINHRYVGELLPHDNMVSFLSAVAATFLNENAIIGKVSPCVTQMEDAAIQWLCGLVGWGAYPRNEQHGPVSRLVTPFGPAELHRRWERDSPTGTVVSGGTVANITALMIARNATFDYLLGWSGAVQALGPLKAWEIIQQAYGYQRMLVLTSVAAHYSVKKSSHYAGVPPDDVVEVVGSEIPWRMDKTGFEAALTKAKKKGKRLLIATVPIAGTTEHGYVDHIRQVAEVLEHDDHLLEDTTSAAGLSTLEQDVDPLTLNALRESPKLLQEFFAVIGYRKEALKKLVGEKGVKSDRRTFIHVDAAHGGGFLTSGRLRKDYFDGIEAADSVTIDGHKMMYCYYPCGGLLVRKKRWAETVHTGRSSYISEEAYQFAYSEDERLYERAEMGLSNPSSKVRRTTLLQLSALHERLGRPAATSRLELRNEPFKLSLEGSRGTQGIMQLYFNIHSLGSEGLASLAEWTFLQARRCEDAVQAGSFSLQSISKEKEKEANHQTIFGPRGQSRGRFLLLSKGQCNQVVVSYVPRVAALKIASWDQDRWNEELHDNDPFDTARPGKDGLWRMVYYLWRVNEHLWTDQLYANPSFTYYIGHTDVSMILPSKPDGESGHLFQLLNRWNDWAVQPGGVSPFFRALEARVGELAGRRKDEERKLEGIDFTSLASAKQGLTDGGILLPSNVGRLDDTLKFFGLKIIIMHPYSDESVISDLLGKLAFYGERSAEAVDASDAACRDWLNDHPARGAVTRKK